LRRRVALKVLPFAAALDPRQLQRFKNEALAAAHLRHENIVPVHAVGEERGVHFYAMQFVEGQSLAALIGELNLQPRQGSRSRGTALQSRPAGSGEPSHVNNLPVSVLPAEERSDQRGATETVAALSTERTSGSRRYFDWVAKLGRQAALALEHAH